MILVRLMDEFKILYAERLVISSRILPVRLFSERSMALGCCHSRDLFVIILMHAYVIDYSSKKNYYYHRPKYSDCQTVGN